MEIITKSGITVKIDNDRTDLAELRGWCMHSNGYIGRTVGKGFIFLHHLVLGIKPDPRFRVDHKDRDHLNNTRGNLRVVSASQNAQNRDRMTKRGLPRGVGWHKGKQKWHAYARLNYKLYHLGYFTDIDEADQVVSMWRAEHMTHSEVDRIGA